MEVGYWTILFKEIKNSLLMVLKIAVCPLQSTYPKQHTYSISLRWVFHVCSFTEQEVSAYQMSHGYGISSRE